MLQKEFVTAGRAVFTLEVPETFQKQFDTKPHYTYRVRHKEASRDWPEAYFVQLLTGPENTKDFSYIGMLNPDSGELRLTAKSPLKDDSWPVKLFRRTTTNIWANTQDRITSAGFKLHHEGRCGRCGRVLTVPSSIESGIGPECIKRM